MSHLIQLYHPTEYKHRKNTETDPKTNTTSLPLQLTQVHQHQNMNIFVLFQMPFNQSSFNKLIKQYN